MMKFMSFIVILAFATVVVADAEVPLPGPGAPPTTPPPPQPTPPQRPTPTPPPYDPNPTPYPTPTPYYPTPTPYPTPYPGNPGQDTTYTLGTGQVGRFKERSFTFTPPAGLRNLRALRITCTNEKVKITSVSVKFKSGQTQRQSTLEGLYRYGNSRISYMYSVPVVSVTVTATSSSVFRTNGIFRVDAAATQKNAQDEDIGSAEAPTFEGNGQAF